jgi:hypothetical protein
MAYPTSYKASRIDEVMKLGHSEIRAELEFCYMRLQSNETEILEAVRSSSANATRCELAEEGRYGEKRQRRIAEKKLQEAIEERDKAMEERDKAGNKAYHASLKYYTLHREASEASSKHKSDSTVLSAIKKLSRSRAVGKRLAVACHPDKVPAELNDSASELFRFIQAIRTSEGCGNGV